MSVTYTCNRTYGDIYGRTCTVTVDRRLNLMPAAQAGIIQDPDGTIRLISYATCVAAVDADGWLTCGGTYSASTRRHINRWMKEFNTSCDYYTAKRCAEKDLAINIYTGEEMTMEDYIVYCRKLEEAKQAA